MPATTPPRPPDALLREMLESAQAVRGYVAGFSFDRFWDDLKTRDAVAMRLIVLGEAARHIDGATTANFPTISFPDIRSTRNRIAHDYNRVNFRIVWDIAQIDIPPLIAALEAHFTKNPPPPLPPNAP